MVQFVIDRGDVFALKEEEEMYRYHFAWFAWIHREGAGFAIKKKTDDQIFMEGFEEKTWKILMCKHLWKNNENFDKSQSEKTKNLNVCGKKACMCKKLKKKKSSHSY